jgi:hypothetical protein
VSVVSWLKLAVCLWLLRKAIRLTRWLLLAATAVAVWPLTLVAIAGYGAAWLRGWPPARLRRAAAWALPMTAVYLFAQALRLRGGLAVALAPARAWEHGWPHLAGIGAARTFALVAPAAVPAGLALAALAWTGRIYALTAGIGGLTASAPISFDARQWRRQVRTARARTTAPAVSRCWPGAGGSRSAAPSARSGTAGTRCSPCRRRPADGTWSSSARPAPARPT